MRLEISKRIKSINQMLCRRCSCRLGDEKTSWENLIKSEIGYDGFEKFPGKVSLTVASYRRSLLDKDNSWLSIKALTDALKIGRCGIIVDDSPEYVVSSKFIQFKSKADKTEIIIEGL